jgi:ferredoxin-NADP reductase/predicted pyridoxine 5'-phosphate oxidase superfamily flavin-nucleotide-binding protein
VYPIVVSGIRADMSEASPFHAGEQQVQERLGVRRSIEPWARRAVRPFLPAQHRDFYARLPFLVAAARDAEGRPWATLLAGAPGFAHSPDPQSLQVDALPPPGDALEGALVRGGDLGLLGIELATRRRNRVNGRIAARSAEGLRLSVDQSFGNCPQYIHARDWEPALPSATPVRRAHARLGAALRRWIGAADTFFVASGHRESGENAAFGMDASHRGGEPGFVRVEDDRKLVFPDYAGNDHFNTLGNLVRDPRAGLLFVDFARGDLLQLTGRTRIDWDPGPAERERFPGARRLVHFALEAAVELRGALPLRWTAARGSVRSLRVAEKVRESADVVSLLLESRDGGPLPGFRGGQHLPIELALADGRRISRTYSLSNAPDEGRYRITVKRHPHGVASRILHDHVGVGDVLSARAPSGDFVLDPQSARPVALVGAGVGLTPLVAMLHELADARRSRPVWFVHGARDGAHHPLAAEVAARIAERPGLRAHVAYSRPRPGDRGHHSRGRVDAALLQRLLPDLEADFHLCGPPGFLADLRAGLEARGVDAERIRFETF